MIYVICIMYLVILYFQDTRYISWLPTIPLYPSNKAEVAVVASYTKHRTDYYTELFRNTDISVSYAFSPLVNESVVSLDDIITRPLVLGIIYSAKYIHNRARPTQIDPTIASLSSQTADTPAYPSGHAFQAYYLADILSQRYPHLTHRLLQIAEDCALARVYAGLHYPSDNRYSRYLVSYIL
jgi:membrane-associated phospholipid phosphatase